MSEGGGVLDADAMFKVLPGVGGRPASKIVLRPVRPLAATLAEAEAQAIAEALVASRGNRTKAARLLGISRSMLYEKLAKMS
jgi:DNA-binding NtrC family response regulator